MQTPLCDVCSSVVSWDDTVCNFCGALDPAPERTKACARCTYEGPVVEQVHRITWTSPNQVLQHQYNKKYLCNDCINEIWGYKVYPRIKFEEDLPLER